MSAGLTDLARLDLRVGTVVSCAPNAKARVPAYVLRIDFGAEGVRTSSAQLTERYEAAALVGRRVVCACGLGPKRVAGVVSECLVLAAVPAGGGGPALLAVDAPVPDGTRIA